MLFIFLLNTLNCSGIIGTVTPGQSLWAITKNIANEVDTIETKIDALEHELNILLVHNQELHSKLDTIIYKSDAITTDTNTETTAITLDNHTLSPLSTDLPHKDTSYNTASNQSNIITSPQTTLELHCLNAGHGVTIININGMSVPTNQKPSAPLISQRTKYMSLLKIISGITLTATSLIYGTIGGSIATTLGFIEQEFGLLLVGPILVAASLPLEYCGYKLTKSGIQDLNEFTKLRKKILRAFAIKSINRKEKICKKI